jgi:cysteine desulfuration protein SufE
MTTYPEKLNELLEDFDFVTDRSERAELLIELADRFHEVPERIATRPFPEENHVQRCESDAYVWAEEQTDRTLTFHFAVENPQGLSARALAVILGETLSGAPLEQVARVPTDVIFRIFGKDLSMGKGQGLMGILSIVQAAARRRMENSAGPTPPGRAAPVPRPHG